MDYFVQTNGIKLHYLDQNGGEPLIVLMHGLTANAHSFDGLIRAGLSPKYRVITPDLRGRGLSDKPASGYSMAAHAADIVGMLDALNIKQVAMGGHSFGGLLSFYIAAHYPERVSKLIILDAAGSLHPNVRELIKPSIDRLGKVLPNVDVYVNAVKSLPYLADDWNDDLESYYRADVQVNPDGTAQSRSKPEAIAEAFDGVLAESWSDHLARIKQPAVLINALGLFGNPMTAPVLPYEQAMETVRSLKSCKYVEVPGNHVTMLFGKKAKQTVNVITEFVN